MERRVTTQDISWFADLRRNKQIDLDPPYQRRSVWSPKDRRFFLDTIFRGYPSPPIFIHRAVRDGLNVHEIVDGKQRLETIFMFIDGRLAIDKNFGDSRLDGKKWKGLTSEQQQAFLDYVLSVEFLKVLESQTINEVFERMNRNSRRLERQELRHARSDGWFVRKVEAETNLPIWSEVGVVTPARLKRMAAEQVMSELLIVLIRERVEGFDQDSIDEVYAEYEAPSEDNPDFDEDAFDERLGNARRILGEIVTANPNLRDVIRKNVNTYSLWAFIALELVPRALDEEQVREVARHYGALMGRAEELRASLLIDDSSPSAEGLSETESFALRYAKNSLGPSTELPQRLARHTALRDALVTGRA